MKRVVDLLGAAVGLFLASIPMMVIAASIRVTTGGPVLHRARRAGLGGRPFVMFKFRTMRDLTHADGRPLPDSVRVTPLGRFLRRTSLDELPELFNVLRGDMSLVGPRPLLMQYLPLYSPEQARRHDVKPGITGWAQIHGRNSITWEEKLALDTWYVEHHGLLLDTRILLRTFVQVVRQDGVSRDGDLDVPYFEGTRASTARR